MAPGLDGLTLDDVESASSSSRLFANVVADEAKELEVSALDLHEVALRSCGERSPSTRCSGTRRWRRPTFPGHWWPLPGRCR